MLKTSKKRLRADEFAIPSTIAAEDFDALCMTSQIRSSDRQAVKDRLDEIVKEFAAWMSNERRQTDRSSDRECLVEARSHITEAVARIKKLGPSGRRALKSASRSLAPMLAAQWINEKFPDDDFAPQRSAPPSGRGGREPIHFNLRAATYFIEECSLEARREFVGNRAVKVACAALMTIGEGLSDSLSEIEHQPGARGGQKPLTYRRYLIVNLAQLWVELGKTASTGPKSHFAAFCEAVAVSIGWPDHGIGSAIPDALEHWRHLPRKSNQ